MFTANGQSNGFTTERIYVKKTGKSSTFEYQCKGVYSEWGTTIKLHKTGSIGHEQTPRNEEGLQESKLTSRNYNNYDAYSSLILRTHGPKGHNVMEVIMAKREDEVG